MLGVLAGVLLRRLVIRAFRGGDAEPEAAYLLARFLQLLLLAAVTVYR